MSGSDSLTQEQGFLVDDEYQDYDMVNSHQHFVRVLLTRDATRSLLFKIR
jgi:hypothetical protein